VDRLPGEPTSPSAPLRSMPHASYAGYRPPATSSVCARGMHRMHCEGYPPAHRCRF